MSCLRGTAPAFLALSLWGSAAFSPAFADEFTTIDVPVPGAIATAVNAINQRGDMVGSYRDSNGNFHGFLLSHRTFTAIDGPGANFTEALGINPRGDIVGDYSDGPFLRHGFVLSD